MYKINKFINIFTLLVLTVITLYPSSVFAKTIGQLERENDQIMKSIQQYERERHLRAEPRPDMLQEGSRFIDEGKYDEAIKCYNSIVSDPIFLNMEAHLYAYSGLGLAYYYKKEYDLSIANCNKAIELDPKFRNNTNVYNVRGLAYAGKEQYDLAISDYNIAIALSGTNNFAYSNRGFAYSKKGQYDLAINDHNMAIALDSKNAYAYFSRGLTYSQKGQYDLAMSDYNVAIALYPNYALAYYNKAITYEKLGRNSEAIQNYILFLRYENTNSVNIEKAKQQIKELGGSI